MGPPCATVSHLQLLCLATTYRWTPSLEDHWCCHSATTGSASRRIATITGIRRNDHITPTLRDTLHWLPVSQRIMFRIALMTYDCIHGRSPVYFRNICSLIVPVPFRSPLRSADNDDIIVPRTRTARYIYIFIRHERQQQKIEQRKKERQTDRQTGKQSTDYIYHRLGYLSTNWRALSGSISSK